MKNIKLFFERMVNLGEATVKFIIFLFMLPFRVAKVIFKCINKIIDMVLAGEDFWQVIIQEFGFAGQEILALMLGVIVTIIVIGYAFINLWPVTYNVTGNISAMTGTDTGTTIFKSIWPVVMLFVGLLIVVAVIFYVIKHFNQTIG